MTSVQHNRDAPTNLAVRANTTPPAEFAAVLSACCDVPRWVQQVLDGLPYTDDSALMDAATAAATFTEPEIDRALAAHPRIGAQPVGRSAEATWSRGEQAGVADDLTTASALREVNSRYEQRFGRVLLICASGLTAEQILEAAYDRLPHDDVTEITVVGSELAKIAPPRPRRARTR